MQRVEAGSYVARCAALAGLLEVSAYPKPGNIHRTRDFGGTLFEHFLAGSVAIAPSMHTIAVRGFDVSAGLIGWKEIELGSQMLRAVRDSQQWQRGGNVNLGIILLLAPLAAAGGATLLYNEGVKPRQLRGYLPEIIDSTSTDDSVDLYRAIGMSMNLRTLGESEELDVLDSSSLEEIKARGLNLRDIFSRCYHRDSICGEWVSDFKLTFEVGFPSLKRRIEELEDINKAVLDTFLEILSARPDSLIIRKRGIEYAKKVSQRAKEVLEAGGSTSSQGMKELTLLDSELQKARGGLNPGTTADLTASSIFVLLLEGWRP
jgi:triphosphoribosyl-dephospho-CoA synthase